MTFDMHPRSRRRKLFRAVATVLGPAMVSGAIPIHAAASPAPGLGSDGSPSVAVNRTVPQVHPPAAYPTFSMTPTSEEIFRARVFGEPLVPVGAAPSEEDNRAIAAALSEFLQAPSEKEQLQ